MSNDATAHDEKDDKALDPAMLGALLHGARLFDAHVAGAYLGVSYWTIRSYVEQGLLFPVRLRSTRLNKNESRRLLFDRRDLDAFVDSLKTK